MNLFDQIINQAKLGTSWQFSWGASFGSINTQDFQSKAPTIQKSLQAEQNLIKQWFSEKEVKFLKLQKEKGVDMNQAFAFVEQKRQEEAKAKNPDLWIMWGLKEGIIWATQFWQQAPSAVGNLLNMTQKYVTTPLIAGGLEAIGAEWAAEKWRSAWEKFWSMAKQNWEQFSSEAMQAFWPLTENQLQARQTGANLALTAPIPLGKVPSIIKGAWVVPTALRGAYYGAVGTPTYTAVSEWRLPTGWEMATGIVWGAVAWPLFEKVAIPAVSWIASKTAKYGEALVKWGVQWAKKSIARDIKWLWQSIVPSGANISTRANRFTANDIREFKKTTGESPWEFATSRGMTKVGDDAVVEATTLWQKSKEQADDALQAIKWRFKFTWEEDLLKTTLDDLDIRLTNTKSPEVTRIKQLKTKYEDSGLTMSEINEVKRAYANNYKYSFVDAWSESALRSRNLQDAIRKWQFKVAEENGLTNLKEINKNTQGWKMFADSLSKKLQGSSGNNAFTLTDWIALSGGWPENIALYLGKKLASSERVKQGAIKLFSKQTKPSIIQASKADIQQSNFKKNVNRGVSGVGDRSGGESLVRPVGLLPAPSWKATWARNVRVNQPTDKSVVIKEKVNPNIKRPWTTSKPWEDIVVKMTKDAERASQIKWLKRDIAKATDAARYGGTWNTRVESAIKTALEKKQITKQEAIDIVTDIYEEVSSWKKTMYNYIDLKSLENFLNTLYSSF